LRRFSQRNSLVTLNEINITPLLDLAFVLLLIFIITRPMLEQSIDLKLPKGGTKPGKVEMKDQQLVEISSKGIYSLNKRQMALPQLVSQLETVFRSNPNAFVSVRADENSPNKYVYKVMDECQKRGIVRFSLKTSAE
jgi:biopolymer transport protein ExbD